jgi:hypothetical protein
MLKVGSELHQFDHTFMMSVWSGRRGVYHRVVTGPVGTQRHAQRCALHRGSEVRASWQSLRQLRCRRLLFLSVFAAGI